MAGPIKIKVNGGFKKAPRYLRALKCLDPMAMMDKYGKLGVSALSEATPVDTGLAASSWRYEVQKERNAYKLIFCNDDIENGFQVAIMIQYGHGTGTGGWVEGRDYINPALRPIFDSIAEEAWNEVKSA